MTDDEPDDGAIGPARRRALGALADGSVPEEAITPETETEPEGDERPPRTIRWLGRIGVYIAAGGTLLAVVGLTAAAFGIQPTGNVLMTLSLFSVSVAMVFGLAFRAYVGDWSMPI